MANPKPKNPFPKGKSPNPRGRPPLPPEIRKQRRLTTEQVAEVMDVLLTGNLEALRAIPKDPNASVMQVVTASIAIKAISKGDYGAFNALLDRTIGKSKERIELSGPNGAPVMTKIQAMTIEEREQEIERIRILQQKLVGPAK